MEALNKNPRRLLARLLLALVVASASAGGLRLLRETSVPEPSSAADLPSAIATPPVEPAREEWRLQSATPVAVTAQQSPRPAFCPAEWSTQPR